MDAKQVATTTFQTWYFEKITKSVGQVDFDHFFRIMSSLLESVITEIDETMSHETVAPVKKTAKKLKIVLDENGELVVKRVRVKGVRAVKERIDKVKEKRVRVKKVVSAAETVLQS